MALLITWSYAQARELRGVEWRRIGDICTNPRLVKNGVGRHDVIQVRELRCGQCSGSWVSIFFDLLDPEPVRGKIRIRIRIQVTSRIRIHIRINVTSRIRIRNKVTSRIRIRIKVTSRIRIRINVMRIRNAG
jgi:hypothetical protein